VFIRLALNPAVLEYDPRGALRIWNWYLYTYLLCAGALLVSSRVLVKTDDALSAALPRMSSLFSGGAVVLLFLLLNIEIADYYATGPAITFRFGPTNVQRLFSLVQPCDVVGLESIRYVHPTAIADAVRRDTFAIEVPKCEKATAAGKLSRN